MHVICFFNKDQQNTAQLGANPGNDQPFLSLWLAGPLSLTLFINTTPGTAAELRQVADDLEAAWTDHAARTYEENARAGAAPLVCDSAADARYLTPPATDSEILEF